MDWKSTSGENDLVHDGGARDGAVDTDVGGTRPTRGGLRRAHSMHGGPATSHSIMHSISKLLAVRPRTVQVLAHRL